MRRRQSAWPAYVDLFGGLLIVTLGGMIMLTSAYRQQVEISGVRKKAVKIARRLDVAMKRSATIDSRVYSCKDDPEDVCVDLTITYELDGETIPPQQRPALREFGTILRQALDSEFTSDERKIVQIVVEGHADSTRVQNADERTNYNYNWRKSSSRAASVLAEFYDVQVRAPAYNIAAVGYADTRRKCAAATRDCPEASNRRTTVRLHVDNRRLKAAAAERAGSGI
jgi:outer membrane protein OmpA-like peptidoglycan-associated protein